MHRRRRYVVATGRGEEKKSGKERRGERRGERIREERRDAGHEGEQENKNGNYENERSCTSKCPGSRQSPTVPAAITACRGPHPWLIE